MIHGIARGTAQVSIKQNGYEIYQSTVPPGPFTIDDLYAAGNGGDLQVTIKETDGTRQVFTVPWSTVPVLQREGHSRFALTAGNIAAATTSRRSRNSSGDAAAWPGGGLDAVRRLPACRPLPCL